MTKQYTPKLDADDQEEIFQVEFEKFKATLERLEQEFPPKEKPQTPKWEKSPGQIGSEIAGQFYQVTSLFHADLRRQIIKSIEAEREVTKHYMSQMGRWWERLNG